MGGTRRTKTSPGWTTAYMSGPSCESARLTGSWVLLVMLMAQVRHFASSCAFFCLLQAVKR